MAKTLETAQEQWFKKHQELGSLLQMPPFSSNYDLREDFQKAVTAYVGKWMPRFAKASDEQSQEDIDFIVNDVPFADVEKRFGDQLAEATLYQKRYGTSPEARDKALKAYADDSKK